MTKTEHFKLEQETRQLEVETFEIEDIIEIETAASQIGDPCSTSSTSSTCSSCCSTAAVQLIPTKDVH